MAAKAIEGIKAGRKQIEMAAELGVTQSALSDALRKNGFHMTAPKTRVTLEEAKPAMDLYMAGKGPTEIGREFGIGRNRANTLLVASARMGHGHYPMMVTRGPNQHASIKANGMGFKVEGDLKPETDAAKPEAPAPTDAAKPVGYAAALDSTRAIGEALRAVQFAEDILRASTAGDLNEVLRMWRERA